jgi:CO/xanthine dehydrogenase FAD-binding subunit
MFKGDKNVTVKTYLLPESVEEAVGYLKDYGSALMISGGGTHTMMLINNGYALPEVVMGLRRAGLNSVAVNGGISLGAMTTMSQVLNTDLPDLLHVAAHNVGGWAIRNMGTVGGNIMMPAPAGDFAVALLALDATVHLVGAGGERSVSLADFYESGRVKSGELLAEIEMPIPAGKTTYLKYARRDANAPTIITVAVYIVMDGDTVSEARIALNGAAQTPMRAIEAENVLMGRALEPETIAQAAAIAAEACDPFSDAVASEWYRRKMVKVYVTRALESLT